VSSGAPDYFGQPLKPDPAIALAPIEVAIPAKSGPLHKVQFVIEFIGPRSIPAPAAVHLLNNEWYSALGQPNIHAMRPADLHWQPLTNSTDGSYDSLALSWDMVTSRGQMNSKSAEHLFQVAERYGPFIQRRTAPLPVPKDVDKAVRALLEIKEGLDIGFSLSVYAPGGGYLERDLWIVCTRLGLSFSPTGAFDWTVPGATQPLLSVTPFGDLDAFAMSGIQAGLRHPGVTIGFSMPLCPGPAQALDGCFYVAQMIARELGGDILDADDRPISDKIRKEYRDNLRQALSMFSRAGMTTGSPEAVRLFLE